MGYDEQSEVSLVETRNYATYFRMPDGHGETLWWVMNAPGMPEPLTWEQLLTWGPLRFIC